MTVFQKIDYLRTSFCKQLLVKYTLPELDPDPDLAVKIPDPDPQQCIFVQTMPQARYKSSSMIKSFSFFIFFIFNCV
jgi:hypothetical protein